MIRVRDRKSGEFRFYSGRMWNYDARPFSRKKIYKTVIYNKNYYYYYYYYYFLYTHPCPYYFSNRWTKITDTSDSFLHVSVYCKSLASQTLLQGSKEAEIAVPPHRHLLARCGWEIMDHFPLETRSCDQ